MARLQPHLVRINPVEPDAELHALLQPLRRHLALPVGNAHNIDGLIHLDHVAHREFPLHTKAKRLTANVTLLEADLEPSQAAGALLGARVRALPAFTRGSFQGLVTERSLLSAELDGSDRPVTDIANEPLTIRGTETVGQARAALRDRHIGRLPVVDERGSLQGLIEWANFLDLPQAPLGRDRRPRTGDSAPDYRVQATTLMDRAPVTLPPDATIADTVKALRDNDASCAILVQNEKPVGIVTCEDILEVLAARAPEGGVHVQITGAQQLDDWDEAKLHEHIDESVMKVARIYGGPEYFYLHLKRYKTEGSREKYSVRTRLATPVGTFHSRNHGYDLVEVVDHAMDRLERIVKESHAQHQDTQRARSARVGRMLEGAPGKRVV